MQCLRGSQTGIGYRELRPTLFPPSHDTGEQARGSRVRIIKIPHPEPVRCTRQFPVLPVFPNDRDHPPLPVRPGIYRTEQRPHAETECRVVRHPSLVAGLGIRVMKFRQPGLTCHAGSHVPNGNPCDLLEIIPF